MANLLKGPIAKLVASALKGAGMTLAATLIKVTPGTRTAGKISAGTNPTSTSYQCVGFADSYSVFELGQSTVIKTTDVKICLLGATIQGGQIPRPTDKIFIDGLTYEIINADRDPASATYECQSRLSTLPIVVVPLPTAAFSSVVAGLVATFSDLSFAPSGSIVAWSWAFGDGGTSTVQSPAHTYASGAVYTVTLTVTDTHGGQSTISHATIANSPPIAAFTPSINGLIVTCTDSSTDADGSIASWAWTFGDSGTSTLQNPTHTYAAVGTYAITLAVTDNLSATNSVSHNVTISQYGSLVVFTGQSNVIASHALIAQADPGLGLSTPLASVVMNSQRGLAESDPISWTVTAQESLQAWSTFFGPELPFGYYYFGTNTTASPFFANFCLSGSNIAQWIAGAGFPTTPKELWLQLLDYLDAQVAAAGRPIDVLYWDQGDSDAVSSVLANAYQAALGTFFAALRARYGNFKVVIVQLSIQATGLGVIAADRDIVRAAQSAYVAANPSNTVMINVDDVPLNPNPHYPADSMVVVGVRGAEAAAQLAFPARNPNRGAGPAPWIQGADMPMVAGDGTANLTPYMPIHKAGDILVCVAQNSIVNAAPTLATANGFTQLGTTIVSNSGGTIFESLAVFTKTAAVSSNPATGAGEIAPVIAPGAGAIHFATTIFTVRGSSGVDATASGANNAFVGGAVSIPGPVTTAANDLVVFLIATHTGNSPTNVWNSVAGTNLAGFGERRDTIKLAGTNYEMLDISSGTKAVAGAVTSMTATLSIAGTWASLAIAFKP